MSVFKIRTRLAIIIGVIIALLTFMIFFSLRTLFSLKSNLRIQVHTRTVIITLKDNLTWLLDAETGERGYIITGDPAYLEPYETSLQHIAINTRKVRELTIDNPQQQKEVDLLETLISSKLALIDQLIKLKQLDSDKVVKDILLTKHGKKVMDSIRSVNQIMQQREEALFTQRREATRQSISSAEIIFATEGVLALLVTLFLAYTIFRELSRRKTIENKLLASNAELERSNEELSSFSYVASHDLQEPLRKIRMFSLQLESTDPVKNGDAAKYLITRIRSAGDRMQRLIESLLQFAHINTGQSMFTHTDLNEALHEALANLSDSISDKNAQINSDKLPVLNAVPIQMQQLFTNLIGNSIKYSRPSIPPEITIRCAKKTGEWQITITDNGIGFHQDYEQKIFQLFQRLHGRSEYEGTGLGLAIVRKIIQTHQGTIRAVGNPGAGASFIFTIPNNLK